MKGNLVGCRFLLLCRQHFRASFLRKRSSLRTGEADSFELDLFENVPLTELYGRTWRCGVLWASSKVGGAGGGITTTDYAQHTHM